MRNDERGDVSSIRRDGGVHQFVRYRVWKFSRVHVITAHGLRECGNVALQQRARTAVKRRHFADDVEHARSSLVRVVKIGQAIHETGSEMQQRHRHRPRLTLDSRVRIRGTGTYVLVETKDASNRIGCSRRGVQRADDVHFRSAGIRKAHIHAAFRGNGADGGRASHFGSIDGVHPCANKA